MAELLLTDKQLARIRRETADPPHNNIRLALGLRKARQRDLAEAAGLLDSQVSEIANGKPVMLETARRISSVFGVCVEDIFPPECAARRRRAA